MTKTYIDWEKDILYGFEEGKNINLVNAIMEGIRNGDEFSPIKILQIGDNEYCLIPPDHNEEDKGGHHRALGFYKKNKSLPCIVEKTNYINSNLRASLIRISNIDMFDHREVGDSVLRDYYTNEFIERSSQYPRLDKDKLLKKLN